MLSEDKKKSLAVQVTSSNYVYFSKNSVERNTSFYQKLKSK